MDLADDVLQEAYSAKMLDSAFQNMAEMGITKSYWMYCEINREAGMWRTVGEGVLCERINQTAINLGGDILATVVQTARKYGIEIFATFKPFDMCAMALTYPEGSEKADRYCRNSIVGGRAYYCNDFPAEHTELCMQRRPIPQPKGGNTHSRSAPRCTPAPRR